MVTDEQSGQRVHGTGSAKQCLRWALVAAAVTLVHLAGAQAITSPSPDRNSVAGPVSSGSVASSSSDALTSGDDRSLSFADSVTAANVTLSTAQILHILEENPGLTVELKSQVADRLTAQGQSVDANSISDETLFAQIASNTALRSSVSNYLRARGYVSQNDLAMAASQAAENANSSSTLPLSGNTGLGADSLGGDDAALLHDGSASSLRSRGNAAAAPLQGTNQSPRQAPSNASTDMPVVLRQPTPYNLQSLRDLYTQLPQDSTPLKRFGSEVFVNRGTASSLARGLTSADTPLDVPVGPDYVVGPGDTLTVNLWGSTTQSIARAVGRDGTVLLPEAGAIAVAGLTLGRAQDLIVTALRRQFRDAQASVTVTRLRSVRVYVTGDVQRPGGYDLSSLATPVSVLYAAGGPTAGGSLRIARHYRGSLLLEEVDLYDFLLHSVRQSTVRFEAGDTLQVPPAGPQIAIAGAVRRPAIYELKPGETKLGDALQDAGGVTAAASLQRVTIERIVASERDGGRSTITLPVTPNVSPAVAAASFPVLDGDRILIGSILPFSEKVVYLEGHVVRPGRLPFASGMRLSDVLRSYRDLLPEPAMRGEVVRLVAPDLHVETLDFNVPEALIGNENLPLQPFDTVRIFGRYEADAPQVNVGGEVLRPGTYPLSENMTAAQLVRMAGGFKRSALRDTADLNSYTVAGGQKVEGSLATVRIGAAVDGTDPRADVVLKAGDVLTIHEITGWAEIGESITIDGQARFPGTYGFHEGERLSEVLRRAGGLRPTAYPEGAVLIRSQVRELEEKSRDELIRQIETSTATARLSPNIGLTDPASPLQLIKAQQDEALAQLKAHPPTGRMVIRIGEDLSQWAGTPDDIEVRRGDVLTIPKRPGFVLVSGQVYNPTALTYTPGRTAQWYLSHAGGANPSANRKNIFVIRANGSVIGRHSGGGWFGGDVLSTRLDPGDVVVVPQKILGSSMLIRNLLTAAQLASSIAITAAVAGL